MSESPGGAFIDQFKNWSIPLFLFRLPRGGKEMHANPLQCAKENRSILYELDGFLVFFEQIAETLPLVSRTKVAQRVHKDVFQRATSQRRGENRNRDSGKHKDG